jgi:hypothetical protein
MESEAYAGNNFYEETNEVVKVGNGKVGYGDEGNEGEDREDGSNVEDEAMEMGNEVTREGNKVDRVGNWVCS